MKIRESVSVHDYVRPPRVSGEGGIVLVWRLLNSTPKDLIPDPMVDAPVSDTE